MNYKKGIAFLMISTTVLGTTGMHTISSFAEEISNQEEVKIASTEAKEAQVVSIPDENLKNTIKTKLGIVTDVNLTKDDMKK